MYTKTTTVTNYKIMFLKCFTLQFIRDTFFHVNISMYPLLYYYYTKEYIVKQHNVLLALMTFEICWKMGGVFG